MADRIKDKPSCNIYWIKIIRGKTTTAFVKPIPLIKRAKNTKMLEIKKLIKLLVDVAIGRISRGKYTFLIITPLATIQAAL